MRTRALIVVSVMCLARAAAAQTWGTYQGNASHTGYVPVTVDTAAIQPLWTRTFASAVNPVAIGDGRVFVTETGRFVANRGLHALDTITGGTVWSYPDFGTVSSINPPGFGNGTVYVQTGQDPPTLLPYVYAFDGATGAPRFRVPFQAQWESYLAPTVFAGDVFVNGGYYGGAYRFDGATGTQRWFAGTLPQYDQWTPAVDSTYVYAYVGDYAPALYVLDRQTGAPAFDIPDPHFQWDGWSMHIAPVLTHDGDVVVTHDGRLLRFDVQGRRIAWEVDRNFQGQATVAGDVIYANDGGTLTAWNALTGTLSWSWFAPGSVAITGAIVVTDTHAFVQSAADTYALNLATRTVDWSYGAAGSVALAGNVLTIADGASVVAFAVGATPAVTLPPTGFEASTIASTQVTLRLTPPGAGAAPTGYRLEGGIAPGHVMASLDLAARPEHTIAVPPGVFYLRVKTVSAAGVSAASNEIRVLVNQAAPPSAPTSLTGLAAGSSLRLAWKPTFLGGAVAGMLLDVSGAATASVALGATEAFAFDGVPPGTYTFSVRARNAFGVSGPSPAVTLGFPGTCGVPQAPARFLAYRTGTVLQLAWDPPPAGPAPTSYLVIVGGAFAGSFPVAGRSVSGAVGPGSYALAVAAVNVCGTGPATATQTVLVP